jgi:hypothetical protein
MDAMTAASPSSVWKHQKTYLWMLIIFGVIHGLLFAYGLAHYRAQMGIQLFIGFTLNVALIGWCYIDAQKKMVAISGPLGFTMLFISWIGVPWYFVRSRGWLGASKAIFGLGLFAIWFCCVVLGIAIGTFLRIALAR